MTTQQMERLIDSLQGMLKDAVEESMDVARKYSDDPYSQHSYAYGWLSTQVDHAVKLIKYYKEKEVAS